MHLGIKQTMYKREDLVDIRSLHSNIQYQKTVKQYLPSSMWSKEWPKYMIPRQVVLQNKGYRISEASKNLREYSNYSYSWKNYLMIKSG